MNVRSSSPSQLSKRSWHPISSRSGLRTSFLFFNRPLCSLRRSSERDRPVLGHPETFSGTTRSLLNVGSERLPPEHAREVLSCSSVTTISAEWFRCR